MLSILISFLNYKRNPNKLTFMKYFIVFTVFSIYYFIYVNNTISDVLKHIIVNHQILVMKTLTHKCSAIKTRRTYKFWCSLLKSITVFTPWWQKPYACLYRNPSDLATAAWLFFVSICSISVQLKKKNFAKVKRQTLLCVIWAGFLYNKKAYNGNLMHT